MNHLGRVAFRSLVLLDDVRLELIEEQFVEKDVVRDVRRPTQPAAVLVIEEDRFEARPVSVKEELVLGAVEELRTLPTVAKQCVWMTFEHQESGLEVLTAHVDPQPSSLFHLRCSGGGQPGSQIISYSSMLQLNQSIYLENTGHQ